MKLEGKVPLVTGAGRGIGREIAVSFALEGASVGVNDLTEERTSGTVAKIGELGREALSLPADVSEERPVREMVEKFLERFGRIDVLVNNAGVFDESPLSSMPVPVWDRMIATNLRSVFLCTRFALPSMLERRAGRIINVASQLGLKGAPDLVHYCAAKSGILGSRKPWPLRWLRTTSPSTA